ncbi:hypothetical protein [Kitasatospora camelliae]|uniref:Uncharacterized protein n=1 Tax=Kitasatospora camelliae TaxID=3156397 RepID=A0AAU8K6B3_9ACTN
MEGVSQRRLDVALWWAVGAQILGLVAGFAFAEPELLRPDYAGGGLPLLAELAALLLFAFTLGRRCGEAAWWAVAVVVGLAAMVVMTLAAGTGSWLTWGALAPLAGTVAVFLNLRRRSRAAAPDSPPIGRHHGGMTAAAASAVALVAAVAVSSQYRMENVDFTGGWADHEHEVTLALADAAPGGWHYVLRRGTCTEEGPWRLDYPQMSTSVQVWLDRKEATTSCLRDSSNRSDLVAIVTGGTFDHPVLTVHHGDGTPWRLTRQAAG